MNVEDVLHIADFLEQQWFSRPRCILKTAYVTINSYNMVEMVRVPIFDRPPSWSRFECDVAEEVDKCAVSVASCVALAPQKQRNKRAHTTLPTRQRHATARNTPRDYKHL